MSNEPKAVNAETVLHEKRSFSQLLIRLNYLEMWKELAVRPLEYDSDDEDLFCQAIDNIPALSERCLLVRSMLNQALPIEPGIYDEFLVPKLSKIPNAGKGLFVIGRSFLPGDVLCFYYGHLHNFHSARHLDDTSYLMLVQGEVLVDPGPLPDIKARYINDPLNDDRVNVRFVPEKFRSAVVAKCKINPGEEIYVSYGDAYWAQHMPSGNVLY